MAKEQKSAKSVESTPSRRERRQAAAGGRSARAVKYPRRGERKKDRWWAGPLCAVMICVLAGLSIFILGGAVSYARFAVMKGAVGTDRFYPGVTVDGVDMSAYSLEEALSIWREKDKSYYSAHNVTAVVDDESFPLTPEDMGYHSDYEDILLSAYAVGRYGTLRDRYDAVSKTGGVWARNFSISQGFDEARLEELLAKIASSSGEPAVDAQLVGFDPETAAFTFEEGKSGIAVDYHELYDDVIETIQKGGGSFHVSKRTVQPGQTVESLQGIFGKVSSAVTPIRDDSKNRVNNLRVATKTINGMRIEPGQTFSMNQTLGRRTKDKGYKAAGALENGVHTSQVGGGICQVSSTMFNAVGRADMEIIERHPHSIPSTYVALGRDAAVNYPNQDFIWRNTSGYPVYLTAKVNKKKQVEVAVYGKLLDDGVSIKLEGVKTSTFRPKENKIVYVNSLPTGERKVVEEKRKGYTCTTYRIYYDKDGKQIRKDELFKSYYAPAGALIWIGK